MWQAKYRAWGAIDAMVVNEVEQNLRFQGQYFDDDPGLHYNTFRHYDLEVGRFITQDPIGLLGGENLYQYAPSPVGWVDPLGWNAKPPYSPDPMKWLERGGSVHSEIDGRTWVYQDWEGNKVRYPRGYPGFTSFERQKVDIMDLKGNHRKSPSGDFGKADALVPKEAADYRNNTWHHHENMRTMQEVPKKIQSRFTHFGGVKNIKTTC